MPILARLADFAGVSRAAAGRAVRPDLQVRGAGAAWRWGPLFVRCRGSATYTSVSVSERENRASGSDVSCPLETSSWSLFLVSASVE
ncbi:hypothetical protein [Streptomyces sp. PTY087I2]|uniref:hypothetical protein n=1 Tax=Streptomyces sp. PTY087I2 TaxID=1819298 RepID=UPI00350E406B